MTKQELEHRIEELEKEIDHLKNENHWLEIKNTEVEELEESLKILRLEIEDLKEKYLPQNLMEEQIFEIFFENKDKFTVEELCQRLSKIQELKAQVIYLLRRLRNYTDFKQGRNLYLRLA